MYDDAAAVATAFGSKTFDDAFTTDVNDVPLDAAIDVVHNSSSSVCLGRAVTSCNDDTPIRIPLLLLPLLR